MAVVVSTDADTLSADLATYILEGMTRSGDSPHRLNPNMAHASGKEDDSLCDEHNPCAAVTHGYTDGLHLGSLGDKALIPPEWWQVLGSDYDAFLVSCHGEAAATKQNLTRYIRTLVTYAGADLLFFRLTRKAQDRWQELFNEIGSLLHSLSKSKRLHSKDIESSYDNHIRIIEKTIDESSGDLLVQMCMEMHLERLRTISK